MNAKIEYGDLRLKDKIRWISMRGPELGEVVNFKMDIDTIRGRPVIYAVVQTEWHPKLLISLNSGYLDAMKMEVVERELHAS